MALYVYRCDACGTEAEEFRAMDRRDEAPACASCGEPMRRVQQPVAHRWVSRTGASLRAPGREWNWPDGKAFDAAEFAQRNPSATPSLLKRQQALMEKTGLVARG